MCVFCVGFTKSILMCSPRRFWTCLLSSLSVFSSVMWLFFLIILLLCLPPLSFLCTLHFFFTLLYYIPSLVPLQTKTLLCTSEALALGKRWDVCLLFLWPNTLRFTGCVWRMVMLASWLSVFSLSFSFHPCFHSFNFLICHGCQFCAKNSNALYCERVIWSHYLILLEDWWLFKIYFYFICLFTDEKLIFIQKWLANHYAASFSVEHKTKLLNEKERVIKYGIFLLID